MKYTYESQEKALNFLIQTNPHDMAKFKALYNIDDEKDKKPKIGLEDILYSCVWTSKEKEELIKLYYHNLSRHYDNAFMHYISSWDYNLADKCIERHNFSGLEVLLNMGNDISIDSIRTIIKHIKDPDERYKYCELLVNHYKNIDSINAHVGNTVFSKKIPSLCDLYTVFDNDYSDEAVSSMKDICNTQDLKLVKLFLTTVKNINSLFRFAVETGNIEIVKLFIESGADVNYQDLEFNPTGITSLKTPIKIAIDNNDLEMVKFLHQSGAGLDYIDQSNKMQEIVNSLGVIKEKNPNYNHECDWLILKYIGLAKTPLEYAINSGAASIIDEKAREYKRQDDPMDKQLQERVNIVKYLYENGATFGNEEMNYTDLICFAIKSNDFDLTEYFFSEALKNNSHLDFAKIIDFIHNPCIIKIGSSKVFYKMFEDGAKPWFRMCEEYSKKMDIANHQKNLKLMLEKLFEKFRYSDYKELVFKYSNELSDEIKKQIPALFYVRTTDYEEILGLGYDINCPNLNNDSILMICSKCKEIDELLSLGANPNYQNPKGASLLSSAIFKLPDWEFANFISNFNMETGKLYLDIEEYDKNEKEFVYKVIDLVDDNIIKSDFVKKAVCRKISPGYPQIIYNEVLSKLSKKGFKVDDEYFTKSLTFLTESYSNEYVTNPWQYLWNLYNNFDNKSINTNLKFPNIEKVKEFKYGTEQNKKVFELINEHLKRNFVTSIDQIQESNKIERKLNYINGKFEDRTVLQAEQDNLLWEISRYIGNLDYRQIIALIDNNSIIDVDSIMRNELLSKAMKNDIKLAKKLVDRGVTIVCYDEFGHDITPTKYTPEEIAIYQSLDKNYNPNQESENLLAEIGCGEKVLSKKRNQLKK